MEYIKSALKILKGLREDIDEGEYERNEIEQAIKYLELFLKLNI